MRRTLTPMLLLLLVVLAACGGGDGADTTGATTTTAASFAGDATRGAELYTGTCMACHGPDGQGIEGLGKPWVGSDFINSSSDVELLAFLNVGRAADDPLNTTGVAMLPKGGNPALTDDDLLDLIAYMRSLNL